MEPITREEQYLNKLTGEEQTLPKEPITREEQYFARLCGENNTIPEQPLTRREQYLAHLCGEDVDLPEKAITRLEQYMAFAAGESQSKPEQSITREEYYWDHYQGGDVPEEKTVGPASSITVTDAVADKAKSLIVSFEPTQQGTPTATDYGKVYRQTTSPSGNMLSVEKLVGGTYAFNQLINLTPTSSGTWGGGTYTYIDGVLTIVCNQSSSTVNEKVFDLGLDLTANHKYAIIADGLDTTMRFYRAGGVQISAITSVVSPSADGTNFYLRCYKNGGFSEQTTYTSNFMVIDLTQMFGTTIADYIYSLEQANAGDGVAFFRALFPEDYYAYNTGELMSVKASAHVIKDAQSAVTNTYNLDANLELRGIPKLDANNVLYYDGDEYTPSGPVTRRYSIVDLGTLPWNKAGSGEYFYSGGLSSLAKGANNASIANVVSVKWTPVSRNTLVNESGDKQVAINSSRVLQIKDSSYSTMSADEFKTAMNEVYLVYELATETTEQSTAYTANETLSGGSQEFTDSRAVKIPVGVVGKARETYGFYMSGNATITANGVNKSFTYNRAGSHSIPYYGITFDAIRGGGTNDWVSIQSYNGETLPGKWLSNMDVYAEGTTPTIGAQVLYKTDNPSSIMTYGPPIEVDMQEGTNTISAVANIYNGSGTEPATVTLTYMARAAARVRAMNARLLSNTRALRGGDER